MCILYRLYNLWDWDCQRELQQTDQTDTEKRFKKMNHSWNGISGSLQFPFGYPIIFPDCANILHLYTSQIYYICTPLLNELEKKGKLLSKEDRSANDV